MDSSRTTASTGDTNRATDRGTDASRTTTVVTSGAASSARARGGVSIGRPEPGAAPAPGSALRVPVPMGVPMPSDNARVSLVQRLSDQSYSSAREIIVKEMKANQEAIAQLEKRIEELVHILKQAGVELPPFPPLNE